MGLYVHVYVCAFKGMPGIKKNVELKMILYKNFNFHSERILQKPTPKSTFSYYFIVIWEMIFIVNIDI